MKFVINVYGCRENDTSRAPGFYRTLQESIRDIRPDDDLHFSFIDIHRTENLTDHDENLMEQIDEGDLVCPVVTINDEIVSDGATDPAPVISRLKAHG